MEIKPELTYEEKQKEYLQRLYDAYKISYILVNKDQLASAVNQMIAQYRTRFGKNPDGPDVFPLCASIGEYKFIQDSDNTYHVELDIFTDDDGWTNDVYEFGHITTESCRFSDSHFTDVDRDKEFLSRLDKAFRKANLSFFCFVDSYDVPQEILDYAMKHDGRTANLWSCFDDNHSILREDKDSFRLYLPGTGLSSEHCYTIPKAH